MTLDLTMIPQTKSTKSKRKKNLMGLHQTKKLLYIIEHNQQSKKATL